MNDFVSKYYFNIVKRKKSLITGLFLIYNIQEVKTHALDLDGNQTEHNEYLIHVVDIHASMIENTCIVDTWTISDVETFDKQFNIIQPEESSNYLDRMKVLLTILAQEIQINKDQLRSLTDISSAVKRYLQNDEQIENESILGDNVILSVNVSNLSGKSVQLDGEIYNSIVTNFLEIARENINLDLEQQSNIDALKDILEITVFDIIPDNYIVKKININMDLVIETIEKYRSHGEYNNE